MTLPRLRKKIVKLVANIAFIGLALVWFYPIFLIIMNSLKKIDEFFLSPISLPSVITFKNYTYAISKINYVSGAFNTLVIMVVSLIVLIISGSLAGYPLARRPSKTKDRIYLYFLVGMVIPTFTMLVPVVLMIKSMGLINNYIGPILVYGGMGMPLAVFLYTGFYKSVPKEIEDAAFIDGCTMFKAYYKIYLPLTRPVTASFVILQSIGIWNDFVIPDLLLTTKSMKTLMPSLFALYGRMLGQGTRWDYLYAAIVMTMAPMIIVFLVANKNFIKGMTEGALKG